MAIKSYKDLTVWQKSMDLVMITYNAVKSFPKEETFAISDQIRRAVVSIPSNIAEGYSRNTDKELLQFLYIARGSKAELETQILIAQKLGYISNESTVAILDLCCEVGKMINSFIITIKTNGGKANS